LTKVAGVLLTVLTVGALLVGCGQDESGSPKATGVPIPGVIATPDLPGRVSPAVVSAGPHELFVFGGQQPTAVVSDRIVWRNDGALVDTRSGKTDALPDPPFDPPLSDPMTVKVDDEVVIVGRACAAHAAPNENEDLCRPGTYSAAIFDVTAKEWRTIKLPRGLVTPRGGVRALGAASDHRVVFELQPANEYWSYSTAKRSWTRLAPVIPNQVGACIADDQIVELTTTFEKNGQPVPPDEPQQPGGVPNTMGPGDGWVGPTLHLFNLSSGTLTVSGPAPDAKYPPFENARMVCLDTDVVVTGSSTQGASWRRYDATTATWSPLPPAPANVFAPRPVWTGSELVLLPSGGGEPNALALRIDTGQWRTIAHPPLLSTNAVWDGTNVIGYAEPQPVPSSGTAPLPVTVAPGQDPPPISAPPPASRPKHYRAGVYTFPT
jgi:hypothetical protein